MWGFEAKPVVLIATALVVALSGCPTDSPAQEFVAGEYGFGLSLPGDWTVTTPTTDVIAIYGLPMLTYYRMDSPGATMAIELYFLDNPAGHPLDDYLTVPRAGSATVIDRHLDNVGGLEVLQVGYEYDPPFLGLIEAEVLHMIETSPTTLAYLQFQVTVGVDYAETLDQIVGSFAGLVPGRSLSFGGLKLFFRQSP